MKKKPQVPRYPLHTSGASREDHGRLMVVMTHNTDMGDSWEREAEEPVYFQRFSVDGDALGWTLLYALTH